MRWWSLDDLIVVCLMMPRTRPENACMLVSQISRRDRRHGTSSITGSRKKKYPVVPSSIKNRKRTMPGVSEFYVGLRSSCCDHGRKITKSQSNRILVGTAVVYTRTLPDQNEQKHKNTDLSIDPSLLDVQITCSSTDQYCRLVRIPRQYIPGNIRWCI